jgi:hypothetical protein
MENKIRVLEDYMTVGCTTGRFCKQPRFAGRESQKKKDICLDVLFK